MEKVDYVGIGVIILALLTLTLWLNSWQPIHSTCYINSEGDYDNNGERVDYFGKQKVIDMFLDTEGGKIMMRGEIIQAKNNEFKITGANKLWLWKECQKW